MKLRYPSPPRVCVINRIILCSAMPRSITIDGGDIVDILVYISASINQNASVLSPTSAWSWLSQYAMFFSPWRRFIRVNTMSLIFHSLSDLCFSSCNSKTSPALCSTAAVHNISLTVRQNDCHTSTVVVSNGVLQFAASVEKCTTHVLW